MPNHRPTDSTSISKVTCTQTVAHRYKSASIWGTRNDTCTRVSTVAAACVMICPSLCPIRRLPHLRYGKQLVLHLEKTKYTMPHHRKHVFHLHAQWIKQHPKSEPSHPRIGTPRDVLPYCMLCHRQKENVHVFDRQYCLHPIRAIFAMYRHAKQTEPGHWG